MRQNEDAGKSTPPLPPASAGDRLRVWLVEDNRRLRELTAELLGAEEGLDCSRQFPSAEAVLDALSIEDPPDVILLDNQMGGMSGVEALRLIKLLARSTRVFMLTSCGDPETRARAFRNGAAGFISKGCSPGEIADCIRRARPTSIFPLAAEHSQDHALNGTSDTARTETQGSRWNASERLVFGLNRLRASLKRVRAGSSWLRAHG